MWLRVIDAEARLTNRLHFKRAVLSLVVWIFKREVRAFGGCLGMHRR
jgi:hypothetical protein